MGCYGIGVGRAMASVIEYSHDDYGPIWPMSIAPYQVQVCALDLNKPGVADAAEKLVADARQLLASLNAVAGRLERGEGTIGKLTAESELYDEVNSLVKDVRQVIDNYRDTTPITTFGSLATGAL